MGNVARTYPRRPPHTLNSLSVLSARALFRSLGALFSQEQPHSLQQVMQTASFGSISSIRGTPENWCLGQALKSSKQTPKPSTVCFDAKVSSGNTENLLLGRGTNAGDGWVASFPRLLFSTSSILFPCQG